MDKKDVKITDEMLKAGSAMAWEYRIEDVTTEAIASQVYKAMRVLEEDYWLEENKTHQNEAG